MSVHHNQRVAVTGGSGFIGTNLVQSLLDDEIPVINLDAVEPRNRNHISIWRRCNLTNIVELTNGLEQFSPTVVYHLGARTDLLSDVIEDYATNTIGVRNLIAICRRLRNLRRVIFASSRLVCKIGYMPVSDTDYCPTTAYGRSKVIGEQIVRESTIGAAYAWTLVRPTSIWGPWFDIPYRNFFDHVRMRRYFHPSGVAVLKSFGFVENTVFQLRHIMLAQESQVTEKTFYLGDYDPIDVLEFANTIACAFGSRPVRTFPLSALKVVASFGDMLKKAGYRNPPLTSFRLENLCTNMLYDFWGLPHITGALPISMEEGVAKTVAWMQHTGASK